MMIDPSELPPTSWNMKYAAILSLILLTSPALAEEWISLDLPLRDCAYQGEHAEPCVVSHLFPDSAPEAVDLVDHYGPDRISVQQVETLYTGFLHQLQDREASETAEPIGYVIFGPVGPGQQQGILLRGFLQNGSSEYLAGSTFGTFISATPPLKTEIVRIDEAGYNDIRESGCGEEVSDSCNLFDAGTIEAATLQEAWNVYVQRYSYDPEREFLDTAVIVDALQQAIVMQNKAGGRIYAGIIGVGAQGPLSSTSALSYALLIQVTDRKGKIAKGGQLAIIATR